MGCTSVPSLMHLRRSLSSRRGAIIASLDMIPDGVLKEIIRNRHSNRVAERITAWNDMAWEVDVITGDVIFFGDSSTGKTYVAT